MYPEMLKMLHRTSITLKRANKKAARLVYTKEGHAKWHRSPHIPFFERGALSFTSHRCLFRFAGAPVTWLGPSISGIWTP
jgi:hypothetical protein